MARTFNFEAVRTFDLTSLTASYQNVGSTTSAPVRKLNMFNEGDVAITVSLDGGTTDSIRLPANGTITYDEYNPPGKGESAVFVMPSSAQIQVKQVTGAAASGNLIVNIVT